MTTPLRVLLVEDSEDDALLVLEALRQGGYEPAYNRVETEVALRAELTRQTWDVVLADYRLPHFNAPAALAAVREVRPDLPFVIISGTVGEGAAVACMRAGAQDFFLKDKLTLLASAVERELREAEGRRVRRRAEERVREQAALLDAANDAILVRDLEGRITFWNEGARRLYGWTKEEALGRSADDLLFTEPPPELAEARRAVLQKGYWAGELRKVTKGGAAVVVASRRTLVRDRQGDPKAELVIGTDVTEKKNLEAQFLQAQRMESVGVLAGGVAHDFNNLLTIINGYAELLLDGLRPDDPTRGLLAEIQKAGARSAALTRQLLAFSRKQVLAPEVLDINGVITELDKMLRRVLGEDVELVLTLQPGLGLVKADPGQLEQVLMNLAVNARDAMPQGGRLVVETGDVALTEQGVRGRPDVRPGRYVLLSVTDTGCGMTEEVKARIFEPFFTTKEKGKGTGLGLATVYGIAKQSGGFVEVLSELGVGTSFKVYLPRAAQPARGTECLPGAQAAPRGGETVLLVEDEPAVRALTRHILQSGGYTVLEAEHGDAALRLAQRHAGEIHLLVSDVVLPGLGGRLLAERLAELRPGLGVLYLSGYTDDAVVRHGVLHEEVHFLQKPFTPAALLRKVREALDAPPANPASLPAVAQECS